MTGDSSCAGVVSRISPLLTFASGKKVFVEIICEDRDDVPDQVIFLCLALSTISKQLSLELGRFYSFVGMQRCSWTTESDIMDTRTIHSRQFWYQSAQNTKITCEPGHVSRPFDLKSLCSHDNTDILQSTLFPVDVYTREMRAVQEVSIEGEVTILHQLGCLEIKLSSPRQKKVQLFVANYRGLDGQATVREGSTLFASFVLPLYLWNECVGFAATVRSRIVFSENSSVASQAAVPAGDENRITSTSTETIGSFRSAPEEVRKRCHMYTSWRLYVDRRLGGKIIANDSVPVTIYRDIVDCLQNSIDINFVSESSAAHTHGTRPFSCIAQLTKIDDHRNVQTEFTSALYSQLYSVRAGHDAEWLSSKLIKLCSCEDVVRLGAQLCDADCCRSKSTTEDETWQVEGVEWLCRLYDLSTLALSCRGKGIIGKIETLRHILADNYMPELPQNTAFIGSILVEPMRRNDEDREMYDDNCMAAFCRACDGLGNVVNVIIREYYHPDWYQCMLPPPAVDATNATSNGDFKGVLIVHNPKVLLEISPLPGAANGLVTLVGEARLTRIFYGATPHHPHKHEHQYRQQDQSVEKIDPGNSDNAIGRYGIRIKCVPQGCFPGARPSEVLSIDKKRPLPADCTRYDSSSSTCNKCCSNRRTVDILPRALRAAQIISGGGINRPSVDRDGVDTNESVDATVTHVRQLLTAPRRKPDGVFSGGRVMSLVGVVVYKGLLADEKQQQSKGPSTSNRRCTLVLRDIAHADTIKAYLPAVLARAAVVGLRVVLRNGTLHVTENLRTVYLKNSDQYGTYIGVLDIAPHIELSSLCSRSTIRPLGSEPDLNPAYIVPPPRTLISRLMSTRHENKALWTLLGRVAYIKKVSICLKCTSCYSDAREGPTGFSCFKCVAKALLQPRWSATVAFDDGAGECLLYAEGAIVLDLLAQPFSEAAQSLADVREAVENGAQRYGKVGFDAYLSHWSKVDQEKGRANGSSGGNQPWEDYFWDEELHDDAAVGASSSVYSRLGCGASAANAVGVNGLRDPYNPTQEELMLEEYLERWSTSTPLMELQVKVIIEKVPTAATPTGGSGGTSVGAPQANGILVTKPPENMLASAVTTTALTSVCPFIARNIKMQEDNSHRPYSVSFTQIPTLSTKRLALEAVAVKILNAEDTRLEAYKQLKALAVHGSKAKT